MKNIVRAGIAAVVLSLGLVGFMYKNGRGVPQDDAAATWYQKAADQPTESARPEPIVITGNNGGVLRDFYERYRTQVAAGETFRIDGRCRSACTLVLAWADRVCITERAALRWVSCRSILSAMLRSWSITTMWPGRSLTGAT